MSKNMIRTNYERVRDEMKPGDLIAFGGMGWISRIIKFKTRSHVSHVGVVLNIDDHGRVMVMESTSLNGKKGVQINRLSKRVAEYNGHMWWFPMSIDSRKSFNINNFWKFMWAQDGKKYDKWQAIFSATLPHAKEDFGKMFCSELVAGAYEKSGVLPSINASEVTPDDLLHMRLFDKTYYQIKSYKNKGVKGDLVLLYTNGGHTE